MDDIYFNQFEMLALLYSNLPAAAHKLDSKLIGSGFMGFLLSVKAQYQ
jgi:hypothetical protein